MQFQIKLTKISVTKGWSDQEVNTQIDKDVNQGLHIWVGERGISPEFPHLQSKNLPEV